MNFVSNRNIVVRSTRTGMSIAFTKGVPTFVHPLMHKDVIEKGIVPVDEKGKTVDPAENPVGLELDKPVKLAPQDGYERELKLVEVFKALIERNNSADFTAGGIPTAKSCTAALGWTVDTKEVKMAWEKHRRELLHGDKE